ncbi:hypothetical protein [Helicobacter sp. 13S00477-4]|uniref:hypothetical protein n=1 Tax=Helicobacter sp. 13S00477-4 TaxID=1905759 RepID=UPI000BA5D5D0|nr:hypothetical protein [Helicobacter sp. 13S00477-4]PAF52311.1 hypothetical protein BKH44_03115 [Helicobacter sp. 13S00477-4]
MKKSFLPPSIHNTYMSFEALISVLILGIALKIFWQINHEIAENKALSNKSTQMFLAQKSITQKIGLTQKGEDFTLTSEKTFVYNGKLIEALDKEGLIYYRYFYPQRLDKYAK